MKKTILFIFMLIPFHLLMAQTDTIKIGAYKTFTNFINNKPFVHKTFKLKPRKTISDVPTYWVVNDTPKVNKYFIDVHNWGIHNGEYLFINSQWVNDKKGYLRVQELGRYSYFEAEPVMSNSQKESVKKSSNMGGGMGTIISKAVIYGQIAHNTHYILDLKTGFVYQLTKNNLMDILDTEPDLKEQFKNEDKQEDLIILKKYIKLLNERLE